MPNDAQSSIEGLIRRSVSPAKLRQQWLDASQLTHELEQLDDQIAFEREAYVTFGQTSGDKEAFLSYLQPLEMRRQIIFERVESEIMIGLKLGQLIAIGLRAPISETSMPEVIAPVMWQALTLDFLRATAVSDDRSYRAVCMLHLAHCTSAERALVVDALIARRRRTPGQGADWVSGAPSTPVIRSLDDEAEPSAQTTLDQAPHPQKQAAVRPRIPDAIRDEIRRRAIEGLLTDNWTQDSEALHTWPKATFPGSRIAGAESIRKIYRADYNDARRDYKVGFTSGLERNNPA